MLATVYRLRHQGQPLQRAEIFAMARTGHFMVDTRNHRAGWPRYLMASLSRKRFGEHVIPVLVGVQLVRVERGGLQLEGNEVVPRGRHRFKGPDDRYPQAWWVALQGRLHAVHG